MKKILITGENSYIGRNFKSWMIKNPQAYSVDSISVRGEAWKKIDFSEYDVILHLAGIAHVSSNPSKEDLYYKINRDLTVEVAKKAKREGVQHFIFMSSIIVYGDSSNYKKRINKSTIPTPTNFYGESKLQAENGIKLLESDSFIVSIVRPPMIYGESSKGNYRKLSKIAKITPLFPEVLNERSMLHIDNLCEFIKKIVDHERPGIFFPQNSEYVSTTDMVRLIAEINGKKIWFTKGFNPLLNYLVNKTTLINKVFGNLAYEKAISEHSEFNYQIRNFRETIELTEKSRESD